LSALPAILAVPLVLHIAGTAIPVTALAGLPKVAIDLAKHETTKKTAGDAMQVVEAISDVFLPGSGLAEGAIFFLLSKSRPMTPQEERMFMSRFGIGSQ
jgi:hypothetical protein